MLGAGSGPLTPQRVAVQPRRGISLPSSDWNLTTPSGEWDISFVQSGTEGLTIWFVTRIVIELYGQLCLLRISTTSSGRRRSGRRRTSCIFRYCSKPASVSVSSAGTTGHRPLHRFLRFAKKQTKSVHPNGVKAIEQSQRGSNPCLHLEKVDWIVPLGSEPFRSVSDAHLGGGTSSVHAVLFPLQSPGKDGTFGWTGGCGKECWVLQDDNACRY